MTTLRMEDLEEGTPRNWVVLLYGQPFSGMTHFLREVPRPLKVHDFDSKIEPLFGQKDITVESYDSKEVKTSTAEYARFQKNWKKDLEDPEIKTIALDSLTTLDIILLRHAVMLDGRDPMSSPMIQHYGTHLNEMKYFFKFKVSPVTDKNIFILCHEHYHIDDESKTHSITPLITGNKILTHLPAFFKDVWHLEAKDNGTRTLHWGKYKRHLAGSLTLSGGGSMDDPSFEKIVKEASRKQQGKG